MKQEELIKSCSDLLNKLCDLVKSRNSLNYYDINISSEYFFIPLLNQIFDCNLKNINIEEKNAAAIDLYDTNGKIAIQVTSNLSSNKIRNTLEKYRQKKLYEKYQRLIVIVIVRSHTYRADFGKDTEGKFAFSKRNDIFTIDSLIKTISALDIEKIANIQKYLEYQLDTLFDKTQVLNIEESFEYISQNTKNILNESFFEIDSETFISDFQKKLDDSKVIHISSLSLEEGKYCILNLLHKMKPDVSVYVIKSKDTWDKAEKFLSDCILIPEFQAKEIPAIKNNITIFIHGLDKNKNATKLPRRTISFLSDKLKENGYEDPYKLLQKTQGLYYYIKSELFTGKLSQPIWEKDNNIAVIVAALLGKWTECDGDKAVIKKLYCGSYENFISYLGRYLGVEDAFIVRKGGMSYDVIYELADPFLSIFSHKGIVNLPMISAFFDLAKSILSDRDPIFDEPFEKHFYLSITKKSTYSNALKTGVIRTLILLATNADYQDKVSVFVRELLSEITSIKDWAYISQFIDLLCEAAPDEVINCFENNIDNHTGLLDMFTVEKSNFIVDRHYYTRFLRCLELLLPCKKYVVRVVKILFALGDKIDKCSIDNTPRNDLSKVFCTWYNGSALTIDEKIELAELGIEKYPYFWDIIYNEIRKNNVFSSNPSFIYRDTDEIIQYTREDTVKFCISYIKNLLSNLNCDVTRLIKLSELLTECTNKLFIDIKAELTNTITNLCDSDKEQIKTVLRKIIYRHRHFANAEWAATPERIEKIEEICLGITFDDPVYDFLYLAESDDLPIFNPVVFDRGSDCYNKNEAAIEETISSEMKRLKSLGIDLSHYLSLIKDKTSIRIGIMIAKYYCESKYDENILQIIINYAQNPQMAVDYVCGCSDSNFTEIYKAIEYLRKNHYADDYYIAFISILPFDEKLQSYIQELSDESAQKYWSKFITSQFKSRDLFNKAIENLLKYSNWNRLYSIVYEQAEILSVEEILAIISDSINKMIAENCQINYYDYLIEEMLSIIYQRIGNDFESYPILFELELQLCSVLGCDNMKCCQYLFKRNANYYAYILSLIYKKEDGNSDYVLSSEELKYFYELERDIKFCPGEENGSINNDILNEWISLFYNRLEEQGQAYLFYTTLGDLFANSPTGSDGLFPHESIREKIEEIGNDKLINAFVISIINKRGVYYATDGKDELKLAQKYEDISRKFAIRYPKTSKIFYNISENYFRESEREREIAENEIF